MATMTSLERCLTILDGGVPDQVAVGLVNSIHVARLSGVTYEEYATSGETMAEAHLNSWDRYHHDILDVDNGVCTLAEAVGCEIEFHDDAGSPPWVAAPALERIEDVDSLTPIDIEADGLLANLLTATRRLSREVGEEVCILSYSDQGPFSLAAQIIDPQDFLVAVIDPDKEAYVEQLLEYAAQQVMAMARALTEAGSHITVIGESISGPDVCSPRVYRRLAQPMQQRVISELENEGIRTGIHICGDATPIISDIVSTGASMLQLDFKVDLDAVKKAAQGHTTIMGTLDPSGVMALGTPETVESETLRNLAHLAQGGGYILAPGCSLPYETPPENVDVLVETARAHGKY